MPRHESITETFIAELETGFMEQAKRVNAAQGWQETQRAMINGTYPYVEALKRADAGWSKDEIEQELAKKVQAHQKWGGLE